GRCAAKNGVQPITKTARSNSLSLNIDLHLIDDVVQIAAGIPGGAFGLGAALAVSGARHDHILAGLGWVPHMAPQPPRVAGLISADPCCLPGSAGNGGDVYFHDVGFAGPRRPVNSHRAGTKHPALSWAGDD